MKIIKWIAILLFLILSAATSFIILSGNEYLFFVIRHTVFQGRLGPSIDEFRIYHNREVEDGGSPEPWPVKMVDRELTVEDLAFHNEYETAAFAVFKRDTLVFEYYDENHTGSSYTNSWSMAKSIIGLLIGAAIDEGLIRDENVLLADYFQQYKGSGITVKHLLTMSSGINFDESYIDPFAHSARALYGKDIRALNDRYVPVNTPGKVFDYEGGNTILLAMILEKVVGKTISEYASEKLWTQVHAEHPAFWSLDSKDGFERVFCCFNSNARDFARIGKLMLHQGVWDGDTLISTAYIARSVMPADLKLESGSVNRIYGYHWWVLQMEKYQGYYARGIQGQYIVVLPDEDLVVVRLGKKRPATEIQGHRVDMLKYIDMARRLTN